MLQVSSKQQQNLEEHLRFIQARLQKEHERSRVLDARVLPIFIALWGWFFSGVNLAIRFEIEDFIPASLSFLVSSAYIFYLFAVLVLISFVFALILVSKVASIATDKKDSSDSGSQSNSTNILQKHIDWTKNSLAREEALNDKKSLYLQACMQITQAYILLLILAVYLFGFKKMNDADYLIMSNDKLFIAFSLVLFLGVIAFFVGAFFLMVRKIFSTVESNEQKKLK